LPERRCRRMKAQPPGPGFPLHAPSAKSWISGVDELEESGI
jgi:hypothetical protein